MKITSHRLVNKKGECWLWNGVLNSGGYGWVKLSKPRRMISVHRLSYIQHKGPIPDGLIIMHKCDNRACLRPAHLSAGTHLENNRDCVKRNRNWQTRKTQCPKGHKYAGRNVYKNKKGHRWCRVCDRERKRK